MQLINMKKKFIIVKKFNEKGPEKWFGWKTCHKVERHGFVGIKFFEGVIKYLQNVLHVPGLCKNLILVNQVVVSWHKLEFTTHTCFIKDKDGIEIATIGKDGNLYRLGMSNYNTTKEDKIDNITQLSIVDKFIDAKLWHPRFGHLGVDGLK